MQRQSSGNLQVPAAGDRAVTQAPVTRAGLSRAYSLEDVYVVVWNCLHLFLRENQRERERLLWRDTSLGTREKGCLYLRKRR